MYNSTRFYPEDAPAACADSASLSEVSPSIWTYSLAESDDSFRNASAPVSIIEFSHRGTTTMRTPRVANPQLALVTDIASKVRKRVAKAVAGDLTENQKRRAKSSWEFTTAAKNRYECSVFELDFSHWSLENPPLMLTFVIRGSAFMRSRKREGSKEIFFEEIAPEVQPVVDMLREKLASRFLSAYGVELDAIFVTEFQMHGNLHFHILLTLVRNEDGSLKLSAHPTGKGGRFAKYNGLEPWAWFELTLAELSGQRGDISRPKKRGRVTHLLQPHEVEPADSIEDYVARFVNYTRKDGEGYEGKKFQHRTPTPYMGQHFSWWGILGFRNKRHAADKPVRIECRTIAADLASRKFLAALSRRRKSFKEMPDGTVVENSMWTVELYRHCLTGGTFERPLTQEEIRQLRRLVLAMNQIPDEVAVEAPAEDYREAVDAPHALNCAAYWQAAPAPWERPGWDLEAFLMAHDDSASYEPPSPAEHDTVRPITELLADWGFSPAEQAAVEKSAVRKSGKAIDAAQFVFTDAD